MDMIEIINELRKQYLSSDNQVLVITVFNDGFMVNRKPRYGKNVENALAELEKTVTDRAGSAAPAVKVPPVKPIKVLPIDRDGARKRVPSGEQVLSGSHTSKWWSRYHFEKNLLTLAFHQLQDEFPGQHWFVSTRVAQVMSQVMGLKIATAKKHITTALKLGIIIKARDGANTIIAMAAVADTEEADTATDEGGDGQDTTFTKQAADEIEKALP